MKKIVLLLFAMIACNSLLADDGLITVKSKFKVAHTADRFVGVIQKKGMQLMKHVKHSQAAKMAGKKLRPTELVIFGNPLVGTPLMQCNQTIAIDLPQKLLVWQDENEQVWMTYNNPVYIADRHKISEDCRGNLRKIAGALKKFTSIAGGVE